MSHHSLADAARLASSTVLPQVPTSKRLIALLVQLSVAALLLSLLLLVTQQARGGEVRVVQEHIASDDAGTGFPFEEVPHPSKNDAASTATAIFQVLEGELDPNAGGLECLNDGRLPKEEDAPRNNLFFRAGSDGGLVLVDLGKSLPIAEVHTYSWHAAERAPQVYNLYAAGESTPNLDLHPSRTALASAQPPSGWRLVAKIDTRPGSDPAGWGGQYGVAIQDNSGLLGEFRYLLLDIHATETQNPFGNTFYSELDVVQKDGPTPEFVGGDAPSTPRIRETIDIADGKYHVVIDTTETPDLKEWAHSELVPIATEWYPKLAELLPSEGYEAPKRWSITFKAGMPGVADTGGTRIRCAADWFRANLQGEARGAVFHEMVHVIQQYGRSRPAQGSGQGTRRGRPAPGWLVEGLTDYWRWYHFEPGSHGADIRPGAASRARYDASYRVTANFIHWAGEQTGLKAALAVKLNATIREGRYTDRFWEELAGKPIADLAREWKASLEANSGTSTTSAAPAAPAPAPK